MVTRTATYTRSRNIRDYRPRTGQTISSPRETSRSRNRRRSQSRARERVRARERRNAEILSLKTRQLSLLDQEIEKFKASGKRVSERGLVTERVKTAKRLQLRKVRKDLAVGSGERWYNKFRDYLKPTAKKFETMNRRLATRPTIARRAQIVR